MERALLLAENGSGRVSPNPMVGAVIVCDGRIIGEGYHAFYGGPHAEVNAIRAVKTPDLPLLKKSVIYVSLEPCAHYGKTPPCASLIVETGIPEVVIGSLDPNPLVAGKGVKILEDAGVKVRVGVLEKECRYLNRKFMWAQVSETPWITLKWAQSADGFMALINDTGDPYPVRLSNPLSLVWMHRERSLYDAIMVGGNTERIDHPKLSVRAWGGNSPEKIVVHYDRDILDILKDLRKNKVTSLLVEGGPTLLNEFIRRNLYNEVRVEVSSKVLGTGLKAPSLPKNLVLSSSCQCPSSPTGFVTSGSFQQEGSNLILRFKKE